MSNPTPPDVAKEHPLPWKVQTTGGVAGYRIHDNKGNTILLAPERMRGALEFIVAAVNATQWIPASTPPTGMGLYVVADRDAYGTGYRYLARFDVGKGWSCRKVSMYLSTPLPPLPEKEST